LLYSSENRDGSETVTKEVELGNQELTAEEPLREMKELMALT
jgi:hypothetical protein